MYIYHTCIRKDAYSACVYAHIYIYKLNTKNVYSYNKHLVRTYNETHCIYTTAATYWNHGTKHCVVLTGLFTTNISLTFLCPHRLRCQKYPIKSPRSFTIQDSTTGQMINPPEPTEGVGERVGTAFPRRVTTHHQNNNSNDPRQLIFYVAF